MHVVILVTCANKKESLSIAEALVKDKAAACVNIIGKIESVFWWEGRIDHSREVLLAIKSQKLKLNRIIKIVRSLHSYKVPEIIAMPIAAGYKPYLDWINDSLR